MFDILFFVDDPCYCDAYCINYKTSQTMRRHEGNTFLKLSSGYICLSHFLVKWRGLNGLEFLPNIGSTTGERMSSKILKSSKLFKRCIQDPKFPDELEVGQKDKTIWTWFDNHLNKKNLSSTISTLSTINDRPLQAHPALQQVCRTNVG